MPSIHSQDVSQILRNQRTVTLEGRIGLPYPTRPLPREPQPCSIHDNLVKSAPLIIKNNLPIVEFDPPAPGKSVNLQEEKPVPLPIVLPKSESTRPQ